MYLGDNMILSIIVLTIIFLLYIQYSPTMGNIWMRDGHFTPRGAVDVMLYPFREWQMWKPEMWIINYPLWVVVVVSGIIFYQTTLSQSLTPLNI